MKKYLPILLAMMLVVSSMMPVVCATGVDTYTDLEFKQIGNFFVVEGNDFSPVSGEEYSFYAAAYGNDGKLIDVKQQPFEADSSLTNIKGCLSFDPNDYDNPIKEVKTMFWNENLIPARASRTFNVEQTGFDIGKEVNISLNASAFAYGSAYNTAPYMAVDGDVNTQWFSLSDANYLRDQFVIDLGDAYSITSLDITLSDDSDANYIIYGATELGFKDKTALTSAIKSKATGKINTLTANEFRYLILEQNEGGDSLGIKEFCAYTTEEEALNHAPTGNMVNLAENKSISLATIRLNMDKEQGITKTTAGVVTDTDPTTGAGWNLTGNATCAMLMVDLGEPQKLSRIAYQASIAGGLQGGGPLYTENFLIVASNSAASYSDYTVLARMDGRPGMYQTTNGSGAACIDTGLLVFEVDAEKQNTPYRYVGLLKLTPEGDADGWADATNKISLQANTLQAYSPSSIESQTEKVIYVSPTGSDDGNGSESSPYATLERAQEEVRKYNSNMQGDIVVNLMPGRYELMSNLDFGLEDSGTNGHDVIWQSADENNIATVSGAKEVKGTWQKGENGIWSVKADNLKFVRELFVNDKIATRARSSKKIYGGAYYDIAENWTHPHMGEKTVKKVGFYVDKSMLGLYENPEDIEFHWISLFRTALFHVDDIIEDPNNANQVIAVMDREYWNEYYTFFDHANATPQIAPNRGFIVENAYELLDEPGEFYFNKKTKTLSYIPRDGEDLNSAEILVPQNEQLMYVHGGNYYNRIHNIQFKNIRFAHTTSFEQEESNIAGGQAEYHYANNAPWTMGRASNLVDWAEEVDFEACVFYGLSTMALHLRNGVYNSNVEGNVFADLGATALCVGTKSSKITSEPQANASGLEDAAVGAPWSASYHYWPGTGDTYKALNTQRVTALGWYSEPWAKEEGTYPWIKLELESAYDLDSFEFTFPRNATAEQRSNFEVLASNDRDFNEYVTLKTYTSAANTNEKINLDGNEKYRYIMLRKTVPGPFCLLAVNAWTDECMPLGEMGAPKDCRITNNAFRRVALQKQGSYPIWINYTNGFDISHNDIDDAPYAGISIGWGWEAANTTAGNNKVNYNRISNVMQYMNDGGGIYVLGGQPGTEVKGNYISDTVLDGMGIYFDKGTAGVSASDNVSVGTTSFFNLNSQVDGNSIKNSYHAGRKGFYAFGYESEDQVNPSGITTIEHSSGTTSWKSNIDMELPTVFAMDNPPEEASRIMASAGLEPQWSWINERIPTGDNSQRTILYGPDSSESAYPLSQSMKANARITADIKNAEAILDMAVAGDLPWEYSPESIKDIEYALSKVKSSTSRSDDFANGQLEEQYALQAAIKNANNSVYHPSYDEMVAMCTEIAQKTEEFSSNDIAAFNETVTAIKSTSPVAIADKAVAANKLEKAYASLMAKSSVSKITGAVIRGGKTTIDVANKKVSIELPYSISYQDAKPSFTVSHGSVVTTDVSKLDYSSGSATVALYNENTGKTVNWTVELIRNFTATDVSVLPEGNKWTGGNPNVIKAKTGNVMTVEPWFTPTMYTDLSNGSVNISINIPRPDTKDGVSLIFASKTDKLEPTVYEDKNTCYMLKLVNKTATLYKVVDGVFSTVCTANNIDFGYDTFNDIEIDIIANADNSDRVTIKSNGTTFINTLISQPIGVEGYFGILSKNMTVKVK